MVFESYVSDKKCENVMDKYKMARQIFEKIKVQFQYISKISVQISSTIPPFLNRHKKDTNNTKTITQKGPSVLHIH